MTLVEVTRDDRVATLTLNRPERMNAIIPLAIARPFWLRLLKLSRVIQRGTLAARVAAGFISAANASF